MSKFEYKIGDASNYIEENALWQNNIMIPHIVNNCPVAGSGFVVALKKRFPNWHQDYLSYSKDYINLHGNEALLGHTRFHDPFVHPTEQHKIIIADMYAQNHIVYDNGNPPIRYSALVKTMDCVTNKAKETGSMIVSCKFGSGLAGGKWDFIETLIKEIWVSNGISVIICVLKKEEIP